MIAVEALAVLLLIVANGVLAMSELAVVSARRHRLQAMANAGNAGAARALTLAEDSGRFLSSVQIGITLVGVLSGAVSGATFGSRLSELLQGYGLENSTADGLGFGLVVLVITYLSLVVGELVPKQIALRNAEGVAAAMARPMRIVALIASPAVFLLDASSRLLLRLLGSRKVEDGGVTEEELRLMIGEAESAGVVDPAERRMIAGVMRLADRSVRLTMTPRLEVEWLDLSAPNEAVEQLRRTSHSWLPAGRGSIDEPLGVVRVKDALLACMEADADEAGPVDLAHYVLPTSFVHDGAEAIEVLEILRTAPVPVALVVDEYGTFEGMVTPTDILEAIVGAFAEPGGAVEPEAVQREDGSWLVEGTMPSDELWDLLGIATPPHGEHRTVAGLVLEGLRRLPVAGDAFERDGWRFEVVDMDGRRIDKVLVTRMAS